MKPFAMRAELKEEMDGWPVYDFEIYGRLDFPLPREAAPMTSRVAKSVPAGGTSPSIGTEMPMSVMSLPDENPV